MKNTTIAFLLLVVAAVAGAVGFGVHQAQAPTSKVGEIIRFTTAATPTSKTIAAANAGDPSTLLIATSSSRQYCAIVNDSANTVYIGLDPVGAHTQGGTGIRLNASGGSYEITLDNLYTGAVYGVASSSSRVTISCI